MSEGCCQNECWGVLAFHAMQTGVLAGPAACFANTGSNIATLIAPALWQCRLTAQTKSSLPLQQHPLCLQVQIVPHTSLWPFQMRRCFPQHSFVWFSSGISTPILEPKQPPQDLSTVQRAAQRAGMHSDISITVAISPSDWSPLAAKLGCFLALSWRKHFVGSIINLTTKLWMVLSQVIKQLHGRKMTQFKGCS